MNESKATRHQRDARRLQAVGVGAAFLVLATLAFTQAGSSLIDWARGLSSSFPGFLRAPTALVAASAVAVLAWQALAFGVGLLASPPADRRSNRGSPVLERLRSVAATVAVAVPAAVVLGAVVVLASRISPGLWWALAGGAAGALMVLALQAGSGLLARFSGATPIVRPSLVEELGALARRVSVDVESIDQLPPASTLTSSAVVTGAGRQRRVIIAAPLVRDWNDDEIAVVVAHELGHHAHRDLLITLVLDVLLLAGGFRLVEMARGARGLAGAPIDLSQLPLVALVTLSAWVAVTPLRHAVSRWQERRADAFALKLTGRSDAFQAAVRRLAATHLAEDRPTRLARWLYHRHPSVAERLAAAEAFQRRG